MIKGEAGPRLRGHEKRKALKELTGGELAEVFGGAEQAKKGSAESEEKRTFTIP